MSDFIPKGMGPIFPIKGYPDAANLSRTVYLAGPISSDPNWRRTFAFAEMDVRRMFNPARILSPTTFPDGWDYQHYMEHCLIMVRRADALVMLPNWESSPGACTEHAYATSLGIHIFNLPSVSRALLNTAP